MSRIESYDQRNLRVKREMLVARVKDLAPKIDTLVGMLDETKVDLVLIALVGLKLDITEGS